MKDKKILLAAIGVVLLLVLGGGGYFFLKNSNSDADEQSASSYDEDLKPLDPSEIGLKMELRDDNKAVRLVMNNSGEISAVEFDLVYEADSTADAEDLEGSSQRNIYDELKVNGKSPFETKYYDLGSCSSGKCKYDTGVKEVKLVMKVTKKDGSQYQVEDSIKLE